MIWINKVLEDTFGVSQPVGLSVCQSKKIITLITNKIIILQKQFLYQFNFASNKLCTWDFFFNKLEIGTMML